MPFPIVPIHRQVLPDEVCIEDVVRRTRHAAHVFLGSAALDWGRTKLRSWLIVEYGMATEWTREDHAAPWRVVAQKDDLTVRGMVEDARTRIARRIIDAASAWSAPAFAEEMVDRSLIARVTDSSAREAYAPVARVELGFMERVESLFIADFLARPDDYAQVTSCGSCGEIELNGCLRHARTCVRQSGVRPPEESGPSVRDGIVTSARARAASVPPGRTG